MLIRTKIEKSSLLKKELKIQIRKEKKKIKPENIYLNNDHL